jgi:lipopolysaccharide transport system ATP-binding protein
MIANATAPAALQTARRTTRNRPKPVVVCRGVSKRFYRYEHRTRTMREFFIRFVLRRPIHIRHAEFTLEGFDLTVYRGDAIALVGRNGSGKSTALRLMAGIYAPTTGRVTTHGRLASMIDLGVGFHPELTGIENISQYASIIGLGRRAVARRVDDIVEFADIGDFVNEPIKFYSSGMHARLAFATAALCAQPDVLLVDEVLVVGDAGFRDRCIEHMQRFRRNGGTLIIVSHDEDFVRAMCDRAVWMDGGRMRMSGRAGDVLDAYRASLSPAALPAAG